MSGNSILKDGRSIHENYGAVDLDKLDEADRVGVVRTAHGDLVFFVNGISQSVAASDLPDKVWAVIGKGHPIRGHPLMISDFF